MEINNFIEELKKLGITPTEKQLNQLDKYYEFNWYNRKKTSILKTLL